MLKKYCGSIIISFLSFLAAISCNSGRNKVAEGEQLAHQYCAGCHAFPDPILLDKKTWGEGVLPKMAEQLNVDKYFNPYSTSGPGGDEAQTRTTPENLFPFEKWEKIVAYYITTAPDSPLMRKENLPIIQKGLKNFTVHHIFNKVDYPVTTLVKIDSINKKIFFGDGSAEKLFMLSPALNTIDSTSVFTGIADINLNKAFTRIVTMGVLKPSDRKLGKLVQINNSEIRILLLDSLNRPVHASYADLNNDGKEDIVLCEFGYRLGALSWYENKGNNKYEKHVLKALPGAVRSEIYDFNKDGKPDIITLMAQGDEGVFIYYNEGKGKFKEERVLQFPPVYGSNYFQLSDFNNDGYMDILTTNGDNGDYSVILKPYHGIRIFLNDGKNHFKEKIFLPVYGAQKAIPVDFDNDGDIDLVSISSFPDYEKYADESFIYWENTGNFHFNRYTFNGCTDGRWMTMDVEDMDGDGDKDIILGNASFSFGNIPQSIKEKWSSEMLSCIVLENTLKKK